MQRFSFSILCSLRHLCHPLLSLSDQQIANNKMGDVQLFWDGSDNRVCIAPVLQRNRRSSRLPNELHGSCHCKLVRFVVRVPSDSITVLDCNCSICAKKGYLHLTVPKDRVTFSSDSSRWMTTYRFGTDAAKHTFCSTCGVQAIYVPRSNPECYAVNVRCLDLDGKMLQIVKLDGKTFSGRLSIH